MKSILLGFKVNILETITTSNNPLSVNKNLILYIIPYPIGNINYCRIYLSGGTGDTLPHVTSGESYDIIKGKWLS
jgi:hypothetical protein